MATNNAISFNQLKKSVFNMKNYVHTNTQIGYIANVIGDFKILIDSEGNVSNDNNPTSQYKKSNGQNYITWAIDNFPITSENLVKMSISVDGSNYSTDMITIGSDSSIGYLSSLELSSGNLLTFQSIFKLNTKYTYLQDGTINNETKQDTQSMVLMFYSAKETLINKTINIKYTIYTYNKNSLNKFPSLKNPSLYSLTKYDNEYKTGIGSINFSNYSSPDYTLIMSSSNINNSFKNTCSNGIIFGHANKLNGINYYNILGFNNTIERKTNVTYNESFINILGQYNTYKADASTVNYKPVSILGNYINACNSGLYIGMAGTFEKDDIMGIADGTARKEKIIFRVKRDGRVKASTPTENDDLTNKKYVDDKVAGIVNSAPETLDTLQELATALGNDPNFATTVATQIGKKVDKVDGKGLSTNDLTNDLKTNYDAAYAYSQAKHSYNDLTDKPTIPSIDGLASKNNPTFTGTISLGRLQSGKVGVGSVAIGNNVVASGLYSHAEGSGRASGQYSHAEGYADANGDYSHAEGYGTTAASKYQHVEGKYNIEDEIEKYAHIVGNGVSSNRSSNAYTLDWSGNGWFAGKVTQEGTPTDDKDLVNKKYVDDTNIETTDEEVDAMLLEVLGGDYSVQS